MKLRSVVVRSLLTVTFAVTLLGTSAFVAPAYADCSQAGAGGCKSVTTSAAMGSNAEEGAETPSIDTFGLQTFFDLFGVLIP